MANPMSWANHSGVLTNNKLNKKMQVVSQPMFRFRQFCDIKESFGKQAGESVNWLKVANTDNYGGIITESSTMHETQMGLTWGTLTVNEYGLGIPSTLKIKTLSEFDIEQIMRQSLMNDMVKVIDGLVEIQFRATPLRAVGSGSSTLALTTDGTATATNNSALNAYHIRKMRLELEKRNVPPFSDGKYVLIASAEACESLEGALTTTYQYTESGIKSLYKGEIGEYGGVRVVKDTFASRYTYSPTARTATLRSWTNAKSLTAYMIGSDTVREAIALPEHIRAKEVEDYGRSWGLGWYAILGFQCEWIDEPNARIIIWDSAA